MKPRNCSHPDFVFEYSLGEHICRSCRLNWRATGKPWETDDYIFDRLLGR